MAEGAPLLREYGVYSLIVGSNPTVSAIISLNIKKCVSHINNKRDVFAFVLFGKVSGGGGGIRTLEGLAPLPVFKTGAFNRSATPPSLCCLSNN